MITLEDVRDAQARIAGRVHRTPLLSSRTLGERTGTRAFLKAESLQRTGSFKVRGALNRVLMMPAEERERGLVAVSAGNHAQAVAWAATAAGARATVVMPESAPRTKVEASRGYGAEIVQHGGFQDIFPKADELRREHGYTFVHPFDDPLVMAGQGTVALEVVADLPDLDALVCPVGGGGLLAGCAAALKALRPAARVIGVEPAGAAALSAGLEAGRPVPLERIDTIADGLSAPYTSERVLEAARAHVDDVVLVSDDEIRDALLFLLERARLLVEPAGAAGVAALLSGRHGLGRDARVAVVLSGGNLDLARLREWLPSSPPA